MEVIQVINFLLTNILTLHWVSNFKSDILTCYEKGDSQTLNMQLLSTHRAAHPNWNMPGVSDFPKGYITKHQHDTKRQAFPCGTKPKPKQLVFLCKAQASKVFPILIFLNFWIPMELWQHMNWMKSWETFWKQGDCYAATRECWLSCISLFRGSVRIRIREDTQQL